MKKLILILFGLLFLGSITASEVKAYPLIEVEGFVNPFDADITETDGITNFSKVTYIFTVTNADSEALMSALKLEFEPDVFFSPGDIAEINPEDWSPYDITSSSGSFYQIVIGVEGTPIGEGQSLTFRMLDVAVFTNALKDPKIWQEGQIWAQSWVAYPTVGFGDGGSTAPVPEAGTLLLLGSGLIGLVFYTRLRNRK